MISRPMKLAVWMGFLSIPTVALSASAAAPAAPSALSSTTISSSQVGLKWLDNSNNELGFVVQRSLHPNRGFADLKSLPENSNQYTDTGLSALTKYYYRVGAFNQKKNAAAKNNLKYSYSETFAVQTLAATTTPTTPPTTSTTMPPTTTTVPRPTTTTTLPPPTTTLPPTTLPPTTLPPTTTTTTMPTPQPPTTPVPGAMTDIQVQNLSNATQTNVPFTFGQVFPQGALLKTETLIGKLANGTTLNLQFEPKATHADGSIRHAIVSAVLPSLGASSTTTISLMKISGSSDTSSSMTPQSIMNAGFDAVVTVNLNGVTYTASANDQLVANQYKTWLSGPIATEWLVVAPLRNSSGDAHPHLTARFDVRSYTGLNKARVDVVVENDWAYEPGPQNFTYDVQVHVGKNLVYSKAALTHYHHARWKKTFWWGTAPTVHLKHNTSYLIQSKALPYYDPTVTPSESALAKMQTAWTGPKTEPMNFGLAQPYMGTTGGRPDIGLNPAWAVNYLLSQDARAKTATLGQADLSGSWSMHYRDKTKDLPHSIMDYPYSSMIGTTGDKTNPVTKKYEGFPACAGDCSTPSASDVSHAPNMSYIPYLVTGDHYYLEELQFWASYMVYSQNCHYREFTKGLMKSEQLRGQGWALRLLGDAGYITPDDHPLKAQFNQIVENNMDWYNTNYTNNSSANQLGVIVNGYSISYNDSRGIAPWMDDFFTQSIGHLAELGYTKAQPLLTWKAKFQISRMIDPNFCWVSGAVYSLNIRDSSTAPFYTAMGEAYRASVSAETQQTACGSAEMAAVLTKEYGYTIPTGSMTGYPSSATGFPSNMQPALAYSSTSGAPNGAKAWQIFINRTVKPPYTEEPQFAIVPRK